jgi:hypothetical protein
MLSSLPTPVKLLVSILRLLFFRHRARQPRGLGDAIIRIIRWFSVFNRRIQQKVKSFFGLLWKGELHGESHQPNSITSYASCAGATMPRVPTPVILEDIRSISNSNPEPTDLDMERNVYMASPESMSQQSSPVSLGFLSMILKCDNM